MKFARAREHLDEIQRLVLEWGKETTYETVSEPDPDSSGLVNCHRYVARIGGPPLPDLSALLGDCLNNFRCVLDHMVWLLSVLHLNDPADTLPNPDHISFPIYADSTKYRAQGLHAVGDDVRAEVERLQTYHAGSNAKGHPLWVLRELNNIDKHRTVHIVGHYARSADINVATSGPGSWVERRGDGPVEDGTVLARVFTEPSLAAFEVEVNINVMRGVAIEETPTTPLLHLGQTLDGIGRAVHDAAQRLIGLA